MFTSGERLTLHTCAVFAVLEYASTWSESYRCPPHSTIARLNLLEVRGTQSNFLAVFPKSDAIIIAPLHSRLVLALCVIKTVDSTDSREAD